MSGRAKKDVDLQSDLHGLTAEELRLTLQKKWEEWRNMGRIRVIHGQGEVLKPTLEKWCREKGIAYKIEDPNLGSMLIFPQRHTLPEAALSNSLRDAGLRLTPEQEAELKDPEAAKRRRQEETRKLQEEAKKRREAEALTLAQRRREEQMWATEIARLDKLDKSRGAKKKEERPDTDIKPYAPSVIPPVVLQHQEGYWRAELIRVKETEEEQLRKEKITGLEKLAPPVEIKKGQEKVRTEPRKPKIPQRDIAADNALFEAELAKFMEQGE